MSDLDAWRSFHRIHELVDRLPDLAGSEVIIEALDHVFTGNDLKAAVDAAEAALRAHGIRRGDRVLIVNENCAALCVLIFAISRIGAWSAIVNARIAKAEIDRIAGHCRPRARLYTGAISEPAAAMAAADGARDIDLGPTSGIQATAIVDEAPEFGEPEDGSAVAVLLYTSGTTGQPKGVMLTHWNLLFTAQRSAELRGTKPGEKTLGVLPISHVFGLSSVFIGTVFGAGELILRSRFVPREIADLLENGDVTIFQGVPAMYAHFLELATVRGKPLAPPKIRYTSAGGAPLDLSIKQRIEAMWNVQLKNGYGLTETTAGVCATTQDFPSDDESVGVLFKSVEARIVDPETLEDMPDGEIGEFWVRSPGNMKGYYHNPEETAKVLLPDGWYRTGDFAKRTSDGYFYIAGRLKELIIRSGFNVYPIDVETALNSHPDVALSAVVGRSVGGNEEVVAFVQPVAGRTISVDALRAHAEASLAPYKRPSEYIFSDNLPVTPAGKILKNSLREEAQKGAAAG